ncbi:MAG: hypothetical protein ACRCZ0_11745 [Cetobacterium sp.]
MKIKINKIILDKINFEKNNDLINSAINLPVKTKGQIGLPSEVDFSLSQYNDLVVESVVVVNSLSESNLNDNYFNLTLKYSIILDLSKDADDILPFEKVKIVNEIGKAIQYEVQKQVKTILELSEIKEIENID